MKILDRYIIKAHIAPFIFGVSVVVFIFLMQFILKYIDQLLGKGLSYLTILHLISLNLAWIVVLAVPIGALFSTLLAFGSLSATYEVTIFKASGISLIRMMLPIIFLGMISSAFLFWFNDDILPDANHKLKTLLNDIQRKKPTFSIVAGQFTTELEGCTILARNIDSITGMMTDLTIYDHRRQNLINVANADSGTIVFNYDYTKLIVTLYNGELHQLYHNQLKDYRKVLFEKYQLYLPASGYAFVRTDENVLSRGDREMSIDDMKKIVESTYARKNENYKRFRDELEHHWSYLIGLANEKVQKSSERQPIALPVEARTKLKLTSDSLVNISNLEHRIDSSLIKILDNVERRVNFFRSNIYSDVLQMNNYDEVIRQYQVEIQKKYAIPVACLIFVLVGCPLGIRTRGGNFGISAAITLAFYIFYWICLIGGEKLADRGFISPFIGMWAGNIIIALLGFFLIIKENNESFSIFLEQHLKYFNLFKSFKS